MSFWTKSTGEAAVATGSFEMGNGGFETIPAGSRVVAVIEDVKEKEWEGNAYTELKWAVVGNNFKGRKIFQKLKLKDKEAKNRDKAIDMLVAIDHNCGGKLLAANREPTEMDMNIAITNVPMIIRLQVWETDDKQKSGNWVDAVFNKNATTEHVGDKKPQSAQQQAANNAQPSFDDDVGF